MVPKPFFQYIQNQYGPAQPQLCCLEAGSPYPPHLQGSYVQSWGGCGSQDPFYLRAVVQGFWLASGSPSVPSALSRAGVLVAKSQVPELSCAL